MGRRGALALLCPPKDGAEIFKRLGGMTPSLSCLKRPLTRAGKHWKEKEAMDREAVPCAVSLDGVPLHPDGDEEACGTRRPAGRSVARTALA